MLDDLLYQIEKALVYYHASALVFLDEECLYNEVADSIKSHDSVLVLGLSCNLHQALD